MILNYPSDQNQSHDNNKNICNFAVENLEFNDTNNPVLDSKNISRSRKKNRSSLVNPKEIEAQAKKIIHQRKLPTEKTKDYLKNLNIENTKKMYVNLFIKKLKQIIVKSEPISHQLLVQVSQQPIYQKKPIQLNLNLEIAWNIICILYIFALFAYSTLSLTFEEVEKDNLTRSISIFFCFIQIIEISLRIFSKSSLKIDKYREQQKYITGQGENYLKKGFIFDFAVLGILAFDSLEYFSWLKWFRIILALKLIQALDKLRYLQIVLIKNFYKEQYWQLIKVFLINFFFAHILSILLMIMAGFNPKQNWLTKNLLHNLFWYEKYVWSCYWSVNIMLTVGFGDISATSTTEALCLIFIEMLSCILFTYNINSVGSILRNLTSYENQKENNIKTFTRMQGKSNLSEDIKNKITNYINESSDMKRKYNIQEEEKLTSSLPEALNRLFLQEVNQKIFSDLPFFRNISSKTLGDLAVKMERKLAHPEEIILQCGKVPQIAILNGGTIGLTIHHPGLRSHGKEFQRQKIESNKKKLLSLYFINNKALEYNIKCGKYCEFYLLPKEKFEQIIRETPFNFQYYCMSKQKDRYFLGEFETFQCKACSSKQFHTLYSCPKFHYLPLSQIVIQKDLKKQRDKKKNQKLPNFKTFHQLKNTTRRKSKSVFEQLKNMQTFPEKLNSIIQSSSSFSSSSSSNQSQSQGISKLSNKKAGEFFQTIYSRQETEKSLEQLFLKLRKEMKEEISKVPLLLNECKVFQWDLECDLGFDFQYYFAESNPSNLDKKSESRIRMNADKI